VRTPESLLSGTSVESAHYISGAVLAYPRSNKKFDYPFLYVIVGSTVVGEFQDADYSPV
jgi:hypothetical protein